MMMSMTATVQKESESWYGERNIGAYEEIAMMHTDTSVERTFTLRARRMENTAPRPKGEEGKPGPRPFWALPAVIIVGGPSPALGRFGPLAVFFFFSNHVTCNSKRWENFLDAKVRPDSAMSASKEMWMSDCPEYGRLRVCHHTARVMPRRIGKMRVPSSDRTWSCKSVLVLFWRTQRLGCCSWRRFLVRRSWKAA